MPWTIIPQTMTTPQGETTEVDSKRIVIEIDNVKRIVNKKTGKVDEKINVMVGASVFFRNDAWKAPVSIETGNIAGCMKIFYSTQHGTFSVQWPHRIDKCPHTGEAKIQEVKTTGLKAAAVRRTLAQNNIPAAFIEHIATLAQTTGTKPPKDKGKEAA